jgi:hypothetical protein
MNFANENKSNNSSKLSFSKDLKSIGNIFEAESSIQEDNEIAHLRSLVDAEKFAFLFSLFEFF